jgi:hypothetical protein
MNIERFWERKLCVRERKKDTERERIITYICFEVSHSL